MPQIIYRLLLVLVLSLFQYDTDPLISGARECHKATAERTRMCLERNQIVCLRTFQCHGLNSSGCCQEDERLVLDQQSEVGHCRDSPAGETEHYNEISITLLASRYNVLPQCHNSMCASNAPCLGGRELSYRGSCWSWGSEEPCESPQVLISDIYGNVSCACPCVDIQDGSCQKCEDDVPRGTFNNERTLNEPPIPERVTIPTVVFQQKYIKEILCSSDPAFCKNENKNME